jgi:hypothetical protein
MDDSIVSPNPYPHGLPLRPTIDEVNHQAKRVLSFIQRTPRLTDASVSENNITEALLGLGDGNVVIAGRCERYVFRF